MIGIRACIWSHRVENIILSCYGGEYGFSKSDERAR